MFAVKCGLLFACCLMLTVASPIGVEDLYQPHQAELEQEYAAPLLSRQARSPQGGSVDLGYRKDQFGREASVQYNHNLYTSNDGRGSIDAYAQGSRNFDHNRNNWGGGIQGKWRF